MSRTSWAIALVVFAVAGGLLLIWMMLPSKQTAILPAKGPARSMSGESRRSTQECYVAVAPLVSSRRITLVKENCTPEELSHLVALAQKKQGLLVSELDLTYAPEAMSFNMVNVPYWEAMARIANETKTDIRSADAESGPYFSSFSLARAIQNWCLVGPMLAHVQFEELPVDPRKPQETAMCVTLRFNFVKGEVDRVWKRLDDFNVVRNDGKTFKVELREDAFGTWSAPLPFEDPDLVTAVTGRLFAKVGMQYYTLFVRPAVTIQDKDGMVKCIAGPIKVVEADGEKKARTYRSAIRFSWETGLTENELNDFFATRSMDDPEKIAFLMDVSQKGVLTDYVGCYPTTARLGAVGPGHPTAGAGRTFPGVTFTERGYVNPFTGSDTSELILEATSRDALDVIHKIVFVRIGFIQEHFRIVVEPATREE